MIRRLALRGILSFRDATLELGPLNVLIGPNACGKSNLIEVMGLLQAVPTDLAAAIGRGGGVAEWLWKGEGTTAAEGIIDIVLENPHMPQMPLRYFLAVAELGRQLTVVEERLENELPFGGQTNPYLFFEVRHGRGVVNLRIDEGQDRRRRELRPDELTPGQSVLHERRDPDLYPEITFLGKRFDAIRLYREWNLGRDTPPRRPQGTDLPSDFLLEDASNLPLVLNHMERDGSLGAVEKELERFYDQFGKISFQILPLAAQLFVREKALQGLIPATRLSDGTLRYLCLLAVLCHPNPPPLICIEEPELGLHPDILPRVAELLREASARGQVIVTTHSDRLVDEFSDEPDSVVVCERGSDGQTEFARLSKERLGRWLEKYRLGELWLKGEVGGTRW